MWNSKRPDQAEARVLLEMSTGGSVRANAASSDPFGVTTQADELSFSGRGGQSAGCRWRSLGMGLFLLLHNGTDDHEPWSCRALSTRWALGDPILS
jgi:hypothetical protein